MRLKQKLTGLVAATGLLAGAAVGAPSAGAATEPAPPQAPTSLAEILVSDGDTFDRNAYDFDIVTQAVLAVLAEKPDSPVGLLTDGNAELTAFVPNDRAFWSLVGDLTGEYHGFFTVKEDKVFDAVASLGIDTIETVLLYHVVPGAPVDSDTAAKVPRNTPLVTAQGGEIKVKPLVPAWKWVVLGDQDPDDLDPFLVPSKLDINQGNPQIAHGIAFVLRPVDL